MDTQVESDSLYDAVQDGNLVKIRELVRAGCELNAFDSPLGWTALHYAVKSENPDITRFLISVGADVNAHDTDQIGETPLGEVAANCSFEIAELLINAGANPLICGWMQLTALDHASQRKKPEGRRVYELLLRASVGKSQDET